MVIEYLTRTWEEVKKVGEGFVNYFKNIIPKKQEEKKEIKKEDVLRNPNITYFQDNKQDINIQPPGTYTISKLDNETALKTYVESEIKEKLRTDELLQKELEQKGQATFFYSVGEKGGKSIGYFVDIKKQGENIDINLKKGEQHSGAVKSAEDLPIYYMTFGLPSIGLVKGGTTGLMHGLQKGLTYAYTYSKGLELSNVRDAEDFGKFLGKTSLELGTAYLLSKAIQAGYDLYQKQKLKNLLEQKLKEGNLVLYREKGAEMQIIDNKDLFVKKFDYDWKLGIIENKKDLMNRIIYDKLDDMTYHIGIQKQQALKTTFKPQKVFEEFIITADIEKKYLSMAGEKTSLFIKPEKYLIAEKEYSKIIKEIDDKLFNSITTTGKLEIREIDVLRLMPEKELRIKFETYKPKTPVKAEPTITSYPPTTPTTSPSLTSPSTSSTVSQIKEIPKTIIKEIKEIPEIKPLEISSKTITIPPISLPQKEKSLFDLELKNSEKPKKLEKQKEEEILKNEKKLEQKEKTENIEKIEEKLERIEKQQDKLKPPTFIFTPRPTQRPPREKEREKEKLKTDEKIPNIPKVPEFRIPKPPKPPEFKIPQIPQIKITETKIYKTKHKQKELKELYTPSLTAIFFNIKNKKLKPTPILKPIINKNKKYN